MNETRSFRLDVFAEGEPVRRGAAVDLAPEALVLAGRPLPYADVYWVSRRAGLLLLFAREATVALKGDGRELDELARTVERRGDREVQRRLLQPLTREVVVCTAGTAVAGRVGDEAVRGLRLAVFTQCGLHLMAAARHQTLAWPVEEVRRRRARGGGDVLVLRKGEGAELRIRYLFPEEIRAVERVATAPPAREARQAPEAADAAAAEEPGAGPPLEMFARGEVARPFPVRLPEFTVSVERLQELAVRAADRVKREGGGRTLPRGMLELHFQELGETALGPLMLRRSAAAGAGSLERAVEAMEAEQLQQDTRAALAAALERIAAVYDEALRDRLQGKRHEAGLEAELRLDAGELGDVEAAVDEALEPLNPLFLRLFKRQELLRRRLRTLERGPPDSDESDEEAVEEVAEAWRDDLRRLDRALGSAWSGLLEHIGLLWSGRLLPRLARAERLPPRRVPEGLWLAAAAVTALVVAATLVYLLIG